VSADEKSVTTVERFLDQFGCLLQACFNPGTASGRQTMTLFRVLVGPSNVENIVESFRLACIEFWGCEHEYFDDRSKATVGQIDERRAWLRVQHAYEWLTNVSLVDYPDCMHELREALANLDDVRNRLATVRAR
jgi:hypothetical protein